MTLGEWLAATVAGGMLGWAIWSLWCDCRPARMDGAWLDRQARDETTRGWLDGPRWWLPREQRERVKRERLVRITESRRRISAVRRKDGTA